MIQHSDNQAFHPLHEDNMRKLHLQQRKEFLQLEEDARKGIPIAQYELGMRFKSGAGTKKNFQQALRWLSTAAYMGERRAMIALARIYLQGELQKAHFGKAFFWYQMAAQAGDPRGWYMMGWICETGGAGVKVSLARAAEFYEKALQEGMVEAKSRLARIRITHGDQSSGAHRAKHEYNTSTNKMGAPENRRPFPAFTRDEDFGFERKTAEAKSIDCQATGQRQSRTEEEEDQDFRRQQSTQADDHRHSTEQAAQSFNQQKEPLEWNLQELQELAEHGEIDSQIRLGDALLDLARKHPPSSETYRRALELSARWYTRAAQTESIEALYRLGALHLFIADTLSPARAYECLRKAAMGGHAKSQLLIARMLRDGAGTSVDLRQAGMWFTRAMSKINDEPLVAQWLLAESGVIVIHEANGSRLLRLFLPGTHRVDTYLEIRGSADANQSERLYWLSVPNHMESVAQAGHWLRQQKPEQGR